MDISLMYIYIHILLIYINYLRYIYIFKYIHTYTCIYIYIFICVCVPWLQKMSPLRRFRPKAIEKSSTLSTWPSSHRLLQNWILWVLIRSSINGGQEKNLLKRAILLKDMWFLLQGTEVGWDRISWDMLRFFSYQKMSKHSHWEDGMLANLLQKSKYEFPPVFPQSVITWLPSVPWFDADWKKIAATLTIISPAFGHNDLEKNVLKEKKHCQTET